MALKRHTCTAVPGPMSPWWSLVCPCQLFSLPIGMVLLQAKSVGLKSEPSDSDILRTADRNGRYILSLENSPYWVQAEDRHQQSRWARQRQSPPLGAYNFMKGRVTHVNISCETWWKEIVLYVMEREAGSWVSSKSWDLPTKGDGASYVKKPRESI